ncbi:MAG: hypothetical protein HY360_06890 [Verrucomicrobia bacterium]|nr:hypothetical protein [Verrucomicrobiota bacterium]
MNSAYSTECTLIDERLLEDLPPRRKRPAWVRNESIACVGAWEPLFHRRRTGTTQVDDEKFYAYEHSEQFVKEILGIGANLIITAFCKNYYVDEEEFVLKRQLAAICKKHGVRLGVYIRADQIYAEVFADRLKQQDLLARQADGRVPVYGNQEWRKNICFHKPGNLEAFKASIRRAIVELDVAMLHLDGFEVGGTETYNACRCDACRRDFTAFLQRRWGNDPQTCKRRFGHTCLEGIEPPGHMFQPAIPTGRVVDPVWQEWICFRCTWTARVARIISEYAYELNPEVAIMGNSGLAVRENAALLGGFDVGSYCQHVDLMCNEDAFDPHLAADGKIIQRVRQHKLANGSGAFLWNYMHHPDRPERNLRLQLSHAAAFNRGRTTCLGFSFACGGDFRLDGDAKRKYADWLKQHWEHFQNLEAITDVVVWREARAMAFAEPITYATAMQIEQLLIEDRIPFHIATDDWPPDTRVLVLPILAFLDDAQCARVVQFVEQGGSVLVIGQTSTLDGWGRRRSDFGLRSILPASVRMPGLVFDQHIAGANDPIEPGREQIGDKDHWARHQIGAGRVVYIPELVNPATQPSLFNADNSYNFGLDLTNWRVPDKADELRRALAWLLDDRPMFAVETERGVLANYYRQPNTGLRHAVASAAQAGRFFAHLVNLQEQPVARIQLRMNLPVCVRSCTGRPPGRSVASVRVFTPDEAGQEKIEWRVEGNTLIAALERLDVYAVITIETR